MDWWQCGWRDKANVILVDFIPISVTFNSALVIYLRPYPLVKTNGLRTGKSPCYGKIHELSTWPFSSSQSVSHYQRVNPIKPPFCWLNPIKPPWNHHFPMVFLWFSYGFPMIFLWFSYGFPMVSSRCVRQSHLVLRFPGRWRRSVRRTTCWCLGSSSPKAGLEMEDMVGGW